MKPTQRLMYLACLLALSFLLAHGTEPSAADAAGNSLPRLNGTIIQYQPWMRALTESQWNRELDAMRKARLKIIVVQWLISDNIAYFGNAPGELDPTESICRYADKHGMRVYLGLSSDRSWWKAAQDPKALELIAAADTSAARTASQRYGAHPSFVGWYVPQEFNADYSSMASANLRRYFTRVAAACRKAAPKPVAISGFYGAQETPQEMASTTDRLLDGTGVSVLLLQDGVGAEHRDGSVISILPFLDAEKTICSKHRCAFWIVPESFESRPGSSDGFAPTSLSRLQRQIALESTYAKELVTFDFFHYMSPYRGTAQRQLYQNYLDYLNSR